MRTWHVWGLAQPYPQSRGGGRDPSQVQARACPCHPDTQGKGHRLWGRGPTQVPAGCPGHMDKAGLTRGRVDQAHVLSSCFSLGVKSVRYLLDSCKATSSWLYSAGQSSGSSRPCWTQETKEGSVFALFPEQTPKALAGSSLPRPRCSKQLVTWFPHRRANVDSKNKMRRSVVVQRK